MVHPFDPLTAEEIRRAVGIVKKAYGQVLFHAVSLHEPRKAQMTIWLEKPSSSSLPARVADVTALGPDGKVYDGLVDLANGVIIDWKHMPGVQPIITLEELVEVEQICRADPKVIEQCKISGVDDMAKVYCDGWTIGYDERFGSDVRLQQALMYYRPHVDDCQYQYPLDFCPVVNILNRSVVAIDIPSIRRPLKFPAPPINYHPEAIKQTATGYRQDLKPLHITQPQGVSFRLEGRYIEWQNWRFHIGFNYREGIVLHDIQFKEKGVWRSIFYRLSLVEMVVPYGNPEHPHHRKHAFDLGEYGAGYMTNSLSLGCDCKGAIQYLDAEFPTRDGTIRTIKNAICIHEEDSGILFKHTDFRDDSVIVTRARKLVIQQIFTAANYEYACQWIFHQDGTIQPEIKLTGILNTYIMETNEDTKGWGTQVFPGVNAHNHQHLFCLRVNPCIDGPNNTVFESDVVASPDPVGSPDNMYGNAFRPERKKLAANGAYSDYDSSKGRTWDMCNTSKIHPYSGKPASYKLVSREVPGLLPKEGSLVWKRAAFARHAVIVTKYQDDQLWPAGRHVPQTSGEPSMGLPEWEAAAAATGNTSVDNTDIVLWHTFGVTHIPAPEDFPIMPVEPITLLLRPRNFFLSNPVMDVAPSFSRTPSQVAGTQGGAVDNTDQHSKQVQGCKRDGAKL